MKLKKSFTKLDKRVLNITLAEILNVLCILLLVGAVGALFTSLSGDLKDLTPKVSKVKKLGEKEQTITPKMKETMDKGVTLIKAFFLKLILGMLAFLVALVALTTLIKGFIYSRYSSMKLKEFMKGFAKINIPWQFAWIALLMLSFTIISELLLPFVIIIEFILYLLLTPIYRASFTTHKTPKALFRQLKNLHLYILPVIIITALGFINFLVWMMISIKPGLIFIVLNTILTLFLFIWGRTYIILVAGDIK